MSLPKGWGAKGWAGGGKPIGDKGMTLGPRNRAIRGTPYVKVADGEVANIVSYWDADGGRANAEVGNGEANTAGTRVHIQNDVVKLLGGGCSWSVEIPA
jgi:hypothetical protein